MRVTSDRGARVLVDVLRALDAPGLDPTPSPVREPSLDDVFLALTGRRASRDDDDAAADRRAA